MPYARRAAFAVLSALFAAATLACGQDVETCAGACGLGLGGTYNGPSAPGAGCAGTCAADQASAVASGRGAAFQELLTCVGNAQGFSTLCEPLACGLTDAFGTPTSCGTSSSGGSGTGSSTVGTSTNSHSSSTFTSSTDSSSTFTSSETSSSMASSSSIGPEDAGGGSCSAPDGGLRASPGTIACGNSTCSVPGSICCESTPIGSGTASCQPPGTPCAGTTVACNEAADCAGGEVCCIESNNTSSGTLSCQPTHNGKCPDAPIATAQICRCDSECPSGSCNFWNCLGNLIEACSNPVPSLNVCTKM